MSQPRPKPPETVWKPLTGMPPKAETWGSARYVELAEQWRAACGELAAKGVERSILDTWLACRRREFAIETGEIEGLYTLKRGITGQLIAEGLEGVTSSHTLENVEDATIRGLLKDQEAALELVFSTVKNEQPLSHHTLLSWHALLTRHQETVTGLMLEGKARLKRVQVEFKTKGMYKVESNNPKRAYGVVYEYCPPEHVRAEMDRLFDLYAEIRGRMYPTEVEAAWLHHRFVRTHPFQDGNGRTARLLMAYAYIRRGEPPPIVTNELRDAYIDSLESADRGDLRMFVELLADLAGISIRSAMSAARKALAGRNRMVHGNGGVTADGRYYPPQDPCTGA